MPKRFPDFIAFFLFAALANMGRADTIVLKNGEKLDGKILSETATELQVDVKVSASIVDNRTIQKADVEKIEKTSPDEPAWQQIKGISIAANSLSSAQYEKSTGALRGFINQFPKSVHVADAQKALTALEEEQKRVDAGELKLNGTWISKDEAQKERYQISGSIALNYMRELKARNDIIGALNTFDQFEKQYKGSRSYPEAVELAKSMLPALQKQASARVQVLPNEKTAQEKAIAAALEPSKSQMKVALESERTSAEAALASSQKQGIKWPPFLPKSEVVMRNIMDKVGSELSHLDSIELGRFRESIKMVEKAKSEMAEKEYPLADESLRKATDLWPENELIGRAKAELAEATAAIPPPATPAPIATEQKPKEETTTTPAAEEPAAQEPTPMITPFRVILALLAIGFIVGGWKAYQSVKSKSSAVLE